MTFLGVSLLASAMLAAQLTSISWNNVLVTIASLIVVYLFNQARNCMRQYTTLQRLPKLPKTHQVQSLKLSHLHSFLSECGPMAVAWKSAFSPMVIVNSADAARQILFSKASNYRPWLVDTLYSALPECDRIRRRRFVNAAWSSVQFSLAMQSSATLLVQRIHESIAGSARIAAPEAKKPTLWQVEIFSLLSTPITEALSLLLVGKPIQSNKVGSALERLVHSFHGPLPLLRRQLVTSQLRKDIETLRQYFAAEAHTQREEMMHEVGPVAMHYDNVLSCLVHQWDDAAGEQLSPAEIGEEMVPTIVYGITALRTLLSWVLYLLAEYREVQMRVHEELDSGLPPDCTILYGTILEALRLYPPFPLVHRTVVRSDTLNSIELPQGVRHRPLVVVVVLSTTLTTQSPRQTHVAVTLDCIHCSPEYWGRPTEFLPERHLGTPSLAVSTVHLRPERAFLPFGLGPRACPAARSSLVYIVHALAAAILSHFSVQPCSGIPPEPVIGVNLFALHGLHMSLVAKVRQSDHNGP